MDRVQRPPMISVTAREESDAAALAVARCVAHAKEEQESSLPRQTSLLPGEVRTPSTMVTLADWAAPGSSIWFDETENNAPTATSANNNNNTNSGGVDGVRRSTHQSPLAAYNAVSDVWGDGSALLGGGEDDVGNERGTAMTHGHTVGGPHDRVALDGPTGTATMPIVDDAVAAKAAATLNALGPHELPTPPLQPQPAPSLSVSAARGSAATSYVTSTGVTHSLNGSNVHAGYEGAAMPAYPSAAHAFPAAPMPQPYAMPPSVQGFYRDGENQRQTSTTGSHYSSNNENNNNNYYNSNNSAAAPTSFFTVQEGRQQQQQRQQMQQQEDEAAEQQAREQQMLRSDGLTSGQAYLPHTNSSHGAGVSLTPGLYGTNNAATGGGANVPMSVSTLMRYGVQQQQQPALMPSQYTPTQPYFVPTSSQTSSHSGAESRRGAHRANFTAPAVEGSGSEAYAYPPHATATAAAAALQPLSAPPTAATMHSGTVSPLSGGGGYEPQGGMMPMYGGMPNNNNNAPYLPSGQSTLPPPPPPMAYEDDNGWQPGRESMRRMTGPAPHESSGPGWHGPPMPMSSATTTSNAYYNSGSVPGIYPVVPPMSAPDTRPVSHVDSDSVGYGAGPEGYAATANDSARRMAGSERMNELQARNGGMGGPQLGSYANGATAMMMPAAGTTTTTTAPAAAGGGREEATGAVPRVKTAGERVHEALYFIANYFPPPPPPKVPAEDRRSRAELWYHYATIWDLTHRLPPPPRTPLPEMELEQRMRLQELTRTPYRGDGWLRRSDHWFNVVQCLFDYPEDNRGSRVDPQFVLQHAVTS